MIIAMRAHATKPDAPPKLICLMMSGRGRCPHLRRPDKRGSTVYKKKIGMANTENVGMHMTNTMFVHTKKPLAFITY